MKKEVGETRLVPLSAIRIDGGTQTRVKLDDATAEDYAAVYRERPATMPDLEAVYDGSHYWLYDGFHRFHGAGKAGLTEVRVNVLAGTVQDARWLACAANKTHGLKRSNEDKRHTVEMAFASMGSQGLSNRALADHCGVGEALVRDVRDSLRDSRSQDTRKGRDGRTINTSNIGKGRKPAASSADDELTFDDPPTAETEAEESFDPPELTPEEQQEAGENLIAQAATGTLPDGVAETVEAIPARVDEWGIPIQPHALTAFDATPKFEELLSVIRRAQKLFNEVASLPGGAFLTLPGVSSCRRGKSAGDGTHKDRFVHPGLEQAARQVKNARPAHTVCPYQYADVPHGSDCRTCCNLGWSPSLDSSIPRVCIERAKAAFGVSEEAEG